MAQTGDADSARGRLPVLAGLLAFTATTALAFARVYRGGGSALRLVAAALGAVLIAAALERVHVLVSTVASAGGLLVTLGLFVFPETTAFGLPTGETIGAIRGAFANVGTLAAREIAPVGPLPALLVAGIVAVWTASFAAHALVARAASGILALLPAAALIAFADVVLEDGVRATYMVAFLLAAFGMLSALGLRSVVRWGRLVPWGAAPRWSLFSTNALRAARRAAVPAALTAVLLPWALPGLDRPGWYAIGRGDAPISIDPIVDLRPSLRLDPPRELFTVRSPRPTYWRMLALDEFDGRRWSAADPSVSRGRRLGRAATLPTSAGPGVRYVDLPTEIRIDRLAVPWLPVPYEPVYVDAPVEPLRFDEDLSTIAVPERTERGLEYRANGAIVTPDPEELTRDFRISDPLYATGSRFTRLPEATRARIRPIAQRIVGEYSDDAPYLQALAIQNHLRKFTYDDAVRAGHETDYLLDFLTRTRRGYCEQFAGSMAVLLRSLDIPARVVVGFSEGSFDAQDRLHHVTTRNAHSWVEVHLGPYGWLPFEPTPSRTNPSAAGFQFPPVIGDQPAPGAAPQPDPRREEQILPPGGGLQEPLAGLGPGAADPRAAGRLPLLVLAGVSLLALALAAIPLWKLASRTVAVRRASSAKDRVLAAHDGLSRRLGELGVRRRRDETLWEYRDRVRAAFALGDAEVEMLGRLTRLAGRAAYGAAEGRDDEAAWAVDAAGRVAAAARASVPRSTRLLALWALPRRGPGRLAERRPRLRQAGLAGRVA